jgi:hypothetical protein
MVLEGMSNQEIGEQFGVSGEAVRQALPPGTQRQRRTNASIIDFEVAPEHKEAHAYKMFVALDARSEDAKPLSEALQRRLEGFLGQMATSIWTYDHEGWRRVKRVDSDGDAFIRRP